MKNYKILFSSILFIFIIIILTSSITLGLYYKKTPTKSFQVGIKFNPNNEWSVDLTEFGNDQNELIKAKKYNYYDHNLYTYDIMPLDIIEYYYQGNSLKVFIKPIQYKYYYFKKNIEFAPDLPYYVIEKTNYNLNENFIISEKYYEKYIVKEDKFKLEKNNEQEGHFKNFFIYYNQNENKKIYSFIKLSHIWKISNINNISTSNKFENTKLTNDDVIDGPIDGGYNNIIKYQFLYKYQIISSNLIYTENYFKDFDNNKVYRIPLIIDVDIKLYFKKKYNIDDFDKFNFKKGDRISIEFEDLNYKKIINIDYIKSKWEELKFENIEVDNENERIYLKDGKRYILDKNIKLITSTTNNYGDEEYKVAIDDSINIDLESKLHTLYCYYEKDKSSNNYLIKAIFTIDDYLMIHQLSQK